MNKTKIRMAKALLYFQRQYWRYHPLQSQMCNRDIVIYYVGKKLTCWLRHKSKYLWTLYFFIKKSEILNKRNIFNKWYWSNCMCICIIICIDPYLSPCIKLNKKGTSASDTWNMIEEKLENSPEHINTGENFMTKISLVEALRLLINK